MIRAQHPGERLGWFDSLLVIIYLLGIYMGVNLPITNGVPLTCAPSGIAGLIMLWRRRDQINPVHLGVLMIVIALYIGSVFSASNVEFLGKRFTGLLQLTYSLVISYALFVTLTHGERRGIARILFGFCIAILVGVVLEHHTALREVSDRVRARIFEFGLYDADLRDQVLYGRVRAKLFTSEPSNVTFGFVHYGFAWLVVSTWRWKIPVYLVLVGLGLLIMRGPTLLLMLVLLGPYLVFLGGSTGPARGFSFVRLIGAGILGVIFLVGAVIIGQSLYAERLRTFTSGRDASTYARIIGPMEVAFDGFKRYPWAGAGLTGEPFIEERAVSIYMRSGTYEPTWHFRIAEALTNYFWLHWIYLGLVWGTIMLIALTIWLRVLGVPSVLFCWSVWVILGQAAGAYVGPRTWTVLLFAAACAVLATQPATRPSPAPARAAVPRYPALAGLVARRRERFG